MSFVKRWCFTLNNYTDEDKKRVKEICTTETCVFAIVGLEIGQNGTKHMQGFIHFRMRKTFKSLQKLLPGAHLEVAKGSDEENLVYCKKEDHILLEVGMPQEKNSSHHSLLDAYNLVELVVNGADLCDLLDSSEIFKIAYGKHQRLVDSLIHKKKLKNV